MGPVRRLLIVACLIVFLDVAFFEAITPLLADYRNDLGLSKSEAGILVGAYPLGSVLAALPAGFAAARFGPRRVLVPGLVIFGLTGAAFGFSHDFSLLLITRFIQGVAGAILWSGALTWLINTAPSDQRGAVIGTALGMAVAGALFGPAIGALAGEIGTEVVFSAVLVCALLMTAAVVSMPDATVREKTRISDVARTIREPAVMLAAAFVAVPSMMYGVVVVLVPLQIDDLGGSRLLVAAGFAAGALVESSLSPVMGRYSDRHGRMLPYAVGAAICAFAILLVPVPSIPVILGALAGIALGSGAVFAPASALLSDSAEATGLHQGFATSLSNMAWSVGQLVGSVAGGALAELAGELLPCVLVAALLLVFAAMARRRIGSPALADP